MEFDEQALIAEGWDKLPVGPFSRCIGQTYGWTRDGEIKVGVLIDPFTANENFGIAHGGAMMTFADISLGYATGQVVGGSQFVTAQLQYQFAGAARVGDFVVCIAEIVRKTSQLVFVRGLMTSGERTIGAADAVFKLVDVERAGRLKAG